VSRPFLLALGLAAVVLVYVVFDGFDAFVLAALLVVGAVTIDLKRKWFGMEDDMSRRNNQRYTEEHQGRHGSGERWRP
jgi:hypothetical protein